MNTLRLRVLNRACPHKPGSNRERMYALVVAMDGCRRHQIAQAISHLCDVHGWSNEIPTRPADRMVENGRAEWFDDTCRDPGHCQGCGAVDGYSECRCDL